MWTHGKDGHKRVFETCHQGVMREECGGREGYGGKIIVSVIYVENSQFLLKM